MQNQFTAPTTYFLQEGKENLHECLRIAFQAAKQQGIEKILVFTSAGEGVRVAMELRGSRPEFENIKLVAVTFPAGKNFKTNPEGPPIQVEISKQDQMQFREHGIPIVRAHLPFDPIAPFYRHGGVLGQDLSLVGEALNLFCGSMSLCVQAIVLACDAGEVGIGEHVIAVTSDTAILAQATSTRRMLGELIVREILCKPAILTIGRKEAAPKLITEQTKSMPREQPKPISAGRDKKKYPVRKAKHGLS
jgi:hypothetical protein